ncbi:MAG: DegT/DnrJ/EryC1/StrS family aminotransferase [Thermoleophilia bacterium]
MRTAFLPFSPPDIGDLEVAGVLQALQSGWITTGPRVAQFEKEVAELVAAPSALAVSSGTDAMQVALATLGIGPGDEVITSTMTFCSTAHVIEHVGAIPVLVDVEADTLNIDPKAVKAAITSRTKALMPVHLYGHPCEMASLRAIAHDSNLHIVEDAAHALPAMYNDAFIGGGGSIAAYSFYATKNLTTAEGGMLTGPQEFIEKARPWALHGMSRDAHKRYEQGGSWHYDVVAPGFKCNMTDIQAALGLAQLQRLAGFQTRRREIVDRYQAAFSNLPQLQLPVERDGVRSALHLYVIRLQLDALSIDRDGFIRELSARRIGSSVHFIPVHMHSYYCDKYGYEPKDFPVAHENFHRIVSLPLYPSMTDDDVSDVVEAVTDIVQRYAL